PESIAPRRARTSRGRMSGSMPRTRIVPLVGMSRVASIFIVVVFPAPFGPRRPKISPGSTTRSIPSTARKRSRLSCSRRSRSQIVRLPRSKSFTRSLASTAGAAAIIRRAQSRGFAARHAQAGGFAPRGKAPRRSFDKDLYPVLVVGDVNDLAREVDAPEELVEIDAEFPKMPAHETAGCEVQLSDPRDRERDRDIDFLCAVLRDPDSQNAAARARRARRVRWSWRSGRSRCEWRAWRARPTLLDVPERAQQPVGLLDVDLPLSEQLEDLLAFFPGHL